MHVRRATTVVLLFALTLVAASCGGTPWPGAGTVSAVGPFVFDPANPTKPDTHWHAALGVYDCDHWLGDATGEGIWLWPDATLDGHPARAGDPNRYAGLHSHDDGVIHMEPLTPDEAGPNATLGRYFEFGGWLLASDGFDFLDAQAKNGDDCHGTPGTLTWKVARWDGTLGPQRYTVEHGDPARYKLYDRNVIVIAFLPEGHTAASIGDPPSLQYLARVFGFPPASNVPVVPPVHTAAAYSSGWSRR